MTLGIKKKIQCNPPSLKINPTTTNYRNHNSKSTQPPPQRPTNNHPKLYGTTTIQN